MNQYLYSLYDALCKEQEYVQQEFLRTSNLPLSERIALGFCFPPLAVSQIEQSRILLRIPKNVHLHNGIEPGELIHIFPPSAEHLAVSGICSDIDLYTVEVISREATEASWIEGGMCCIQIRLDEKIFRQQKEGLLHAIETDSPLKQSLLEPIEIPIPQHFQQRKQLHPAQSQAIETFLQAPYLSIIHGPPGTGKTHTIAHLCEEMHEQNQKLWVLADSNAAVDHLCLALKKRELPLVRMGSPFRISKKTWPLSIHHMIQIHPQQMAVQKLEKEIRKGSGSDKAKMIREKRALEQKIRLQIMEEAQIIVCTLGSLYKIRKQLPTPAAVIIDEASQVIDPAIWTLVPYIPKLLLVGDPHQLGPVIHSQNPILKNTLIKRKIEQQSCPMLNIQHRMHHRIQQLVQPIYGDRYTAAPQVANHQLCDIPRVPKTPLTQSQILWIDTSGAEKGEERDPLTRSLFNPTEIEWVCSIWTHLTTLNIDDIGIITPYSAQVQRLREKLPTAEVNTVSAFQGQEREVILCSFVRANFDGELGFVADIERLTVSITRAKRLLIGIGDISVLSCNKHFERLFSTLEKLDVIYSIWEENPHFLNQE